MKEHTVRSRYVFTGQVLSVRVDEVLLPDGRREDREIVERREGVRILPVTNDGQSLLLLQYRHAIGQEVLTFPGGGVEPSDGNAEDAAHRELFEETGYCAGSLKEIFVSPGSAAIRHRVHYFLARNLYRPDEPPPPSTEHARVLPVPWQDTVDLAERLEFTDPACSLVILYTERMKLLRYPILAPSYGRARRGRSFTS